MFRKIALIALLSVSSFPVLVKASSGTTLETVKKSRGLGKWFGTIIPCFLSLLSVEVAIRTNKDNPERQDIVAVSRFMRMMSLILGCFFIDEWIKTDLKIWCLSKK